jgi:3-oxoadipate enol-lactonase
MQRDLICAAHPADLFEGGTAQLLEAASGVRVVCVNPRGDTLEAMVDDLEAERQRRGLGRWVFWGMSGGGWLGEIYAHKYPQALTGLILESACACFRARLADPACLISPAHPSWRPALEARGLFAEDAHAEVGDPAATEWMDVAGVGEVFRRRGGPALLVSPFPVTSLMRERMPMLWTADALPWLPALTTPALVIAASADPVVPVPHARAVHQALAGSRFVLVDGAGHVPVTQNRLEVSAAVRAFLAE